MCIYKIQQHLASIHSPTIVQSCPAQILCNFKHFGPLLSVSNHLLSLKFFIVGVFGIISRNTLEGEQKQSGGAKGKLQRRVAIGLKGWNCIHTFWLNFTWRNFAYSSCDLNIHCKLYLIYIIIINLKIHLKKKKSKTFSSNI